MPIEDVGDIKWSQIDGVYFKKYKAAIMSKNEALKNAWPILDLDYDEAREGKKTLVKAMFGEVYCRMPAGYSSASHDTDLDYSGHQHCGKMFSNHLLLVQHIGHAHNCQTRSHFADHPDPKMRQGGRWVPIEKSRIAEAYFREVIATPVGGPAPQPALFARNNVASGHVDASQASEHDEVGVEEAGHDNEEVGNEEEEQVPASVHNTASQRSSGRALETVHMTITMTRYAPS